MGKNYILATDLGGSGTKTMLFDLSGEIVSIAFRESKLYHPEPFSTTNDPEEVFLTATDGIKECMAKSRVNSNEIDAIVLDGQQAGLMWVDEKYRAISYYDSWLDSRYGPFVDIMNHCCADRILQMNGNNKGIVHGPKILWWKNNKPEVFKKAYKMIMLPAYVGGRLADLKGADAYFEETSLGYSGIADNMKSKWDKQICDAVGIPNEKLPRIVKSTEIVGKLSKKYADYLDLPSGIPIVSGGGDFPAAALGAGICKIGQTGDVAGTASIFFACIDKWKPDTSGEIRFLKSPIPELWYTFGLTTGGGCLRWFRDTFFKKEKEKMSVYKHMDEKSEDIPIGCNGLSFYPYIGGKLAKPDYRGAWIGINWEHRKEHFYRAILESIAYEYKFYGQSIMKLLGIKKFEETRVIGGGSTSNIWNQMKSDVLGLPYITLKQQECSLFGSAIIAGCAIGVYKDFIGASKLLNEAVKKINPITENTKTYNEKYKKWIKFSQKQNAFLFGI